MTRFARGARRTLGLAGACALLALGSPATPASADFHLISIREVFPGASAQPDAEYVQLQAYAAGQNVVANHSVTFYGAGGGVLGSEALGGNVPNGQDQMTVLLASAAAESAFGVVADEGMAPNQMDPTGGAVCWAGLDCVSWGAFSGSLPSAAGSPAAAGGIPDGLAIRRTISPGCPTLLEAADDRNDGAVDFLAVFPGPRPNSTPPAERPCSGMAVPIAGAGAPGKAPQTRLTRVPRKRSTDRSPTFRFASDTGASFRCKLDRRRYRRCRSPFTARRLSTGRHRFRVQAQDRAGQRDPSPATYFFRVLPKRR